MTAGRIVYYLFLAALLGLAVMLITSTAAKADPCPPRPISCITPTYVPLRWSAYPLLLPSFRTQITFQFRNPRRPR